MAAKRFIPIVLVLLLGIILGAAIGVGVQRTDTATTTVTTTIRDVLTTTLTSKVISTETVERTTTLTYTEELPCLDSSLCFKGKVTKIVDGDTLYVNNVPVRLALVDTPERGEAGYREASEFTASVCAVGSEAIVDVDDGQLIATNRLIARVICGGVVLNEALLKEGHAIIDTRFCSVSEFASEPWAKEHGC